MLLDSFIWASRMSGDHLVTYRTLRCDPVDHGRRERGGTVVSLWQKVILAVGDFACWAVEREKVVEVTCFVVAFFT